MMEYRGCFGISKMVKAGLMLAAASIVMSGVVSQAEEGAAKLSLTVKDQPMKVALQQLSVSSGVEVVAADRWLADWPVSLALTNATVDQGLKILLGNLNYTLSYDRESGKVTRITIRARMPEASGRDAVASLPLAMPAMPPALAPKEILLLDNAEILPPDEKGGKGVTVGQMKAIGATQNAVGAAGTPPFEKVSK